MRRSRVRLGSVALCVAPMLAAAACGGSPTIPGAAAPPASDTFPSGDVRLSYALDLPSGAGPFPAMVLGHGSGRTTKNEATSLATPLVRAGYAVLRYDKRGVGSSTGVYEGVSVVSGERVIGLLADDMAAGVAFLRTRPEIDGNRIGLIGASQAGWVIPLAAERAGRMRAMVLISGPTVSVGLENFYSSLAEGTTANLDDVYARLPAFRGAPGYDPRAHLERLDVPGLWLLGGQDRSIPVRDTVDVLSALRAAGRPYRWIVYPNAGHGLMDGQSGASVGYVPDLLEFLGSLR